ncbi:hypothetical protein AALA13_06855, partial [Lachnospiraceae bacterium 50-23]
MKNLNPFCVDNESSAPGEQEGIHACMKFLPDLPGWTFDECPSSNSEAVRCAVDECPSSNSEAERCAVDECPSSNSEAVRCAVDECPSSNSEA